MTSPSAGIIFDSVVSVSYFRDVLSWRYTQHLIERNITSRQYFLIVDDEDFEMFNFFTTSLRWTLIKSSTLIPTVHKRAIYTNIKKYSNTLNPGWYFQQFLKLEFLRVQNISQYVLIWDADTVPLKQLSFPSGYQFYYQKSSEHHRPYWELNKHYLGASFSPYPGFSFISQFLGISTDISAKMFESLCSPNLNLPWYLDVLRIIATVKSQHRFSEYELLGSYALSACSSSMYEANFDWERYPTTSQISILNIKPLLQSVQLDYVALERRQFLNFNKNKDRLLYLILKLSSFVFSCFPTLKSR